MSRNISRHCAVFAVAAGLSACAQVTPEPAVTDFDLPAAFTAASAESAGAVSDDERWWREFADPQLNQFVETALVGNPGLAQAVVRTQIAEAQTRLQRADQLPQIGVGAGVVRQRQNVAGIPTGAGPGTGAGAGAGGGTTPVLSTGYDAALDVSWELDLWGRLAAMSAAARADYLASGEQLRAMRQSVAAQVVQTYFEIVHSYAQVDLSARTVESLAEMSRQIGNRVEAGIASPADGMLAEANLESARAGLEQRREALARSLRQLDILLGDYPGGRLATAQQLPAVPAPPSSGVPSELLERRPDIRAAELALLSAGYRLGSAERSFLPSLSLSGSAGYAGTDLSDLFDSSNLIWSIGGRLLQPVFQGGRLVAQVDISEGQSDETLYAYAETALNALSEVETALAVDTLLERRETALDNSASAAESAVRVSLNRYRQGIDPFLNVLESQQRALDGRSAYIAARQARLNNRIALHLALGGGFTTEMVPATDSAGTAYSPVDPAGRPEQ